MKLPDVQVGEGLPQICEALVKVGSCWTCRTGQAQLGQDLLTDTVKVRGMEVVDVLLVVARGRPTALLASLTSPSA